MHGSILQGQAVQHSKLVNNHDEQFLMRLTTGTISRNSFWSPWDKIKSVFIGGVQNGYVKLPWQWRSCPHACRQHPNFCAGCFEACVKHDTITPNLVLLVHKPAASQPLTVLQDNANDGSFTQIPLGTLYGVFFLL